MSDIAKAAAVGSVTGIVGMWVGLATAAVARGEYLRRKAKKDAAPPSDIPSFSVVQGGAS